MAQKDPSLTDKHVASRIRLRRRQLGMSQEDLASSLDVTFQQVQKYEKGTNRVSAGRLQEIAKTLAVPMTYFFEAAPGSDEPQGSEAARLAEVMASPEIVKLARALSRFQSPAIWQALTQLSIAIAEEMEQAHAAPNALTRQSG